MKTQVCSTTTDVAEVVPTASKCDEIDGTPKRKYFVVSNFHKATQSDGESNSVAIFRKDKKMKASALQKFITRKKFIKTFQRHCLCHSCCKSAHQQPTKLPAI